MKVTSILRKHAKHSSNNYEIFLRFIFKIFNKVQWIVLVMICIIVRVQIMIIGIIDEKDLLHVASMVVIQVCITYCSH